MSRLLPVATLVLALFLASALAVLPADTPTPASTASPTADASETPEPSPSASPEVATASPSPTPGPTPVPTSPPPGSLYNGVWVRITGTDACLNVRAEPGLVQRYPGAQGQELPVPVLNCLPDGFVGKLIDNSWYGPNNEEQHPPIHADGHAWWYMLGQGWVAQDWITPISEEAPFPPRPELADAGLIAFTRQDGVWVVGADGSNARLIYPVDQNVSWVSALRWSADGLLLAVSRSLPELPYVTTVIVDASGAAIEEHPGITEPNWSPNGRSLSAIRVDTPGELGGYNAVPIIIDRATRTEVALAPPTYLDTGPVWSPDGSHVALTCRSLVSSEYLPDGTLKETRIDCGGDGVRVVSANGADSRVIYPMDPGWWYGNLSWSPDGSTIAMYASGNPACNGYALIDALSGTLRRCLTLPEYGDFGGRCGGGSESGASDWSADSTTLAYHWQFREGENGVALMNLATNERRMILATDATSVSFSGDGSHLVFSGSGHLWIANSSGGDAAIVTEGSLPAWQPIP